MSTQEKPGLTIDLGTELSEHLTVHKNFNQEIIVTTSDKLHLVLMETKESLTSKRDWLTPLTLSISFVATLCTSEFKDAFNLPKDSWRAIFILLTVASIIWFGVTLFRMVKNWRSDDIKTIIERIKLNRDLEKEKNEKPPKETRPWYIYKR